MIYKDFQGKKISWLGYGAMRMPVTEPRGPIDWDKAADLIDIAYNAGINYYDTAYFYHSGKSQVFLGETLSRYPRDTWYIANKFPGNLLRRTPEGMHLSGFGDLQVKNINSIAEVFEQQLIDCGLDYFDFYMLHNVSEETYNVYTDTELGIVDYMLEQKKRGRIKHFGFSAHARPETLEKFLTHRNVFEFAQIQINYLDSSLQQAQEKYDICIKHGIPVIAMEPVRGGKLANPGDKAVELLKAHAPDATPVSWALRYLQKFPEMFNVLSGMSTVDQLEENIRIFSVENPVTAAEQTVLDKVVGVMAEAVPCTGCNYCIDVCPVKLNIPKLLSLYNEYAFEPSWTVGGTLRAMKDEEKPDACISCGACNPLCPQHIDIPSALGDFAERLKPKQ
ncbi:MAG: aldo/keto reductase [Defluviitaleaceae bacterium]|nr:aldo/keto reductase [Defluviitaleaceae bacterium]